MNIEKLIIPDLLLITPKVFTDERGFFYESFNHQKFLELTGINLPQAQDNHSLSKKGVLRGMHYQSPPKAQGKLVRAVRGEVFDVAVDIRKNSATFGQWAGVILSAENKKQLWVPPGFAHGFLVLSDEAEFIYKTTDYYSPAHEKSLRWNDPEIGIKWPKVATNPILAEKDATALLFKNIEYFS